MTLFKHQRDYNKKLEYGNELRKSLQTGIEELQKQHQVLMQDDADYQQKQHQSGLDVQDYARVITNETRMKAETKIHDQEGHYNDTYVDWATVKNVSD